MFENPRRVAGFLAQIAHESGGFNAVVENLNYSAKGLMGTFKNKKQRPGLILKTSSVNHSIMDREDILDRIRKIQLSVEGNLPNVYLIHGELSDEEINELYNHPKVKAHVSFTKGEGYGRPLLEASISAKPVIASGYSGHLDFLDKDMSILLPGEIKQIHPSAAVQDMLIPESGWFTVDYKKASEILEDVYKNCKKYTDGAKKQSYRSRTEFNLDKMAEVLVSVVYPQVPSIISCNISSSFIIWFCPMFCPCLNLYILKLLVYKMDIWLVLHLFGVHKVYILLFFHLCEWENYNLPNHRFYLEHLGV